MSTMRVAIMGKKTMTQYGALEGNLRISKSYDGDKWFIIKDLTDFEMELLNTDKEYILNEYSTDDFFLIVS